LASASNVLSNILKSPSALIALKAFRLMRKLRSYNSLGEAVDAVFSGAPKEVKDVVRRITDIATAVAGDRSRNAEDIAREVALALGVPENQVEEFINVVMPVAELIVDELREKLITSESTEVSAGSETEG